MQQKTIYSEELILRSTMIHSKNEILEHINEKKIYFPQNFESKLLKWNCFPLINLVTTDVEVSFGVFFFQMLQLSLNQRVKDYFQEVLKYKLKDLQMDQFIYLCHLIFQKQSLNPFPQSFEFKSIGDFLQESFIYEKHIPDRQPSYYKSLNGIQVQEINEQDIKYRILLYVSGEEQGNLAHIIFSTNNDVGTLFSNQSISYVIPKNQNQQPFVFQQFQPFNQKQVFNQNVQANQQQINKTQTIQTNQQQINNTQPIQTNQQQISNTQTIQTNQQQTNNTQEVKVHNMQQWQIISNSVQQGFFTQSQNQVNQNQKKLQTVNSNCIINNFQQNQQEQGCQMKFMNQPNMKKFGTTVSIQQFPELVQSNNFLNQNQIQQDKVPFNQSNLNTRTEQQTEEIDLFSTQIINEIQQDQTNTKIIIQPRFLTNYIQQNQQDSQECTICNMNYNQELYEAIMTPCCNIKVHAYCFQQDLNQKAQVNMNFEKITCYSCLKSLKNYQDFLKNNISIPLFCEIVKKNLLADIPMRCCKCSLSIKASDEILNTQVQLECLQCHTKLCSLCRQEYHGKNLENQQCPSLQKEIQKAFQGMPILVCPFCQLFQTKDDKCNHVKCFNCKKDICSACSVDRVPILAHGNHYHRIGCPDYQPWVHKGKINKTKEFDINKCKRCKESGKPCEYPMSLSEYKKLKQF